MTSYQEISSFDVEYFVFWFLAIFNVAQNKKNSDLKSTRWIFSIRGTKIFLHYL